MKKCISVIAIAALMCLAGVPAANAQFSVSPHAGLAMPFSDLGDAAEFGFGGGITAIYDINEDFSGIASFDYHKFGEKDLGLGIKISGAYMPVLAGVMYKIGDAEMTPYVTAQAGMYLAGGDFADNEFGFAPGFGILKPVGELTLNVNAKYNFVMSDPSGQYLSVNFGLLFPLGK
ncbi:outer membrane beta-barrel protein [candidate division KSB1 bacterium]